MDRGPISAKQQLQGEPGPIGPLFFIFSTPPPAPHSTIIAHHLIAIIVIIDTSIRISRVTQGQESFRAVSARLSISTLLRPGGVLSARHGSHDLDRAENGERWPHEKNQLISIEATVRARKGNFQFVAAPKPRAGPPGTRTRWGGGRSLQ